MLHPPLPPSALTSPAAASSSSCSPSPTSPCWISNGHAGLRVRRGGGVPRAREAGPAGSEINRPVEGRGPQAGLPATCVGGLLAPLQ